MEELVSEKIKVKAIGMISILFDRFVDMSADEKPAEQKLYLDEKKGLILPSENIYSFFFAEKPSGCAARFEGKQWRNYKSMGMSYVAISPEFIPITRDGKQIKLGTFVNEWDETSKIRVLHHKANVQKGRLIIPSPKARPALYPPWELIFTVEIWKNNLITVEKIKNWLIRGGIEIALGTYRPRFGRFMVEFPK